MKTFGRRTFLRGAALLGATAVGGSWLTSTASAGPPIGPHEAIVRDAAMVWHELPLEQWAGPLLGNGSVTTQVFGDQRGIAFTDLVRLDLAGTPTGARWQLDLWNAELTGTVTTTRGAVELSALVHRQTGVLMVTVTPSGGEVAARWAGKVVGRHEVFLVGGTGDPQHLLTTHRAWWNRLYTNSFVSLPDTSVQRFHVIQQYHAAATVAPGTALSSVPSMLAGANQVALLANVDTAPPLSPAAIPGTGSKGGAAENSVMAWNLPALWSLHEHRGDSPDAAIPLLRRAVDFYRAFLVRGSDGFLHLPVTHSPGHGDVADCTYDLALLRWAAGLLGEHDLVRDLVPYHIGPSGLMLGAGRPLTRSHRTAAHLVGLFPLHDSGISRDVAQRSYRHWASMREDWTVDSHVAAASLAARVREPNAAAGHLRHVLDLNAWSVPFGVSQAVLDLVVHGRSGAVDVFPSIPDGWDEVSVESLRVPGACLIDASRSRGRTDWVRIRGAKGQSLLVGHDIEDVRVTDPNGTPLPAVAEEAGIRVTLPPSGAVVLSRRGHVPDLLPRVVSRSRTADATSSKA
ncbi:hypothetical protein [Saccharothrix coeruleofusca]|uniref:Uncharacterized protein n=1 Tax=Saccharothrix coeruleofusca TaxID=33919 RepID=A0A918EFL7_9PSEU|nr:hypothetical protein [Saccharothrix coeruleofusca]GGP74308.1 hypothetical protein GCM10010185_54820 [Saccharothrix coeruleofusca]